MNFHRLYKCCVIFSCTTKSTSYVYIYPFFKFPFHVGPHRALTSALYAPVGSHESFVSHTVPTLHACQSQSPNSALSTELKSSWQTEFKRQEKLSTERNKVCILNRLHFLKKYLRVRLFWIVKIKTIKRWGSKVFSRAGVSERKKFFSCLYPLSPTCLIH